MPTGDGLLVRLSPVDRELTASALAGLAEAAARFGNGLIEVTARGSLQVRGLVPATVEPFAEAVAALGIEPLSGISVEIGALAGLDPTELVDTRPVAATLRRRIAAAGLAERLGPKTSVALDGGGALHLDAVPADVRLRATADGWRLVGGVEADTVADPVESALNALAVIAACEPRSRRIATPLRPAAEPIGVHRLRDGFFAVGMGLPFGQTTASILRDLARAAGASFRLAPGRALLIVEVGQAAVPALVSEARRLGFIVDAADPRRSVAACPGCPACASGEIPARALAERIVDEAAPLLDGSITLHISGCAKGCAHPRPTLLALVGVAGGCELALDGSPVGRMRPAEAMRGLALLADVVARERATRETALGCLGRMGAGRVTRLLQGHRHA